MRFKILCVTCETCTCSNIEPSRLGISHSDQTFCHCKLRTDPVNSYRCDRVDEHHKVQSFCKTNESKKLSFSFPQKAFQTYRFVKLGDTEATFGV